MSIGGRADARQRILRWVGLAAAVLVVLALIFLVGGHWILGVIFAILAVVAVWAFVQMRSVR